jgi:hypothetical protein
MNVSEKNILKQIKRIVKEKERKITYPLYDLEFDTGEVISPMIYSQKEWNKAINRMYYACFYAVSALLASKNINITSHAGLRQKFLFETQIMLNPG